MKIRSVLSIFTVALFLGSSTARAEIFHSRVLSKSTFMFGAEPEITLGGDNDFTFFLHGGYGFGNGYDLRMKVGFGRSPLNDDDVQVSGMVDYALLGSRDGKLALYLGLGASNWGDFSIENQVVFSFNPGPFALYTGLDDALRIDDNAAGDDVTFPIEWVIGVEVPIRSKIHLNFEGGIELYKSSSFISGGIRAFF